MRPRRIVYGLVALVLVISCMEARDWSPHDVAVISSALNAVGQPMARTDNITVVTSQLPSKTPFENTAKATPPGSRTTLSHACPLGTFALQTGQSPTALGWKPLLSSSSGFDVSQFVFPPLPTGVTPAGFSDNQSTINFPPVASNGTLGTDNQMVRLLDGSLLLVHGGSSWGPSAGQTLPYANEMVAQYIGDSPVHAASRGYNFFFYRSTDCGQTWTYLSTATIDYGSFAGGKYGFPRMVNSAYSEVFSSSQQATYPNTSNKMWWVGGGDREELYACPFTGNIYLTTDFVSGAYSNSTFKPAPNQPGGTRLQGGMLLMASQAAFATNSVSWTLVSDQLGWAGGPRVMTSTGDGRLFMVSQGSNNLPQVQYSTSSVTSGTTPTISAGVPAAFVDSTGKQVPIAFTSQVQLGGEEFGLAVSRRVTGPDRIRFVYPVLNANNMQEARLVNFDATTNAAANVAAFSASNPADHSVMYPTFIEPDYIDLPIGVSTDASLLYWFDVPSTTSSNPVFTMNAALVTQDSTISSTFPLSVLGGVKRTWQGGPYQMGDYMSGGFFFNNNNKTLNYVAQWVEPTGMTENVVTVNPGIHGTKIETDGNPSLLVNAWGGASEGNSLKITSLCTPGNLSCSWSYVNGMIVSDGDPTLAVTMTGSSDPFPLIVTHSCDATQPACRWTYSKGEFLSDANPALGINAWGGASDGNSLVATHWCTPTNKSCTWTLPHVIISSAADGRLNPFTPDGMANGSPLVLAPSCPATSGACTVTMTGGMIFSDMNPSFALNAWGGATSGNPLAWCNYCSSTNNSCTWHWSHGALMSDGGNLPVNALGGAVSGASLVVNSACTNPDGSVTNPDCLFSALYANN
jgi:hypothetical protein